MSDTVLLEIIKTVGIIAAATLSTIAVFLGRKSIKDTKDLSIKVDGRLTELLEVTKEKSELAGHKAGVADQKAESKVELITAAPIKLEIPKLVVEMKPPEKPPEQ